MQIETERLLLRPITMEDAGDIFEYSKNPHVGSNAGWKPHGNIEETIEIMKMIFINQDGIFGIILKSNKKLIGIVGVMLDPKRQNHKAYMLGYSLAEPYWGQGIMTEAVMETIKYGFSQMDLDLISAYCYPENERSKRILKKCGFKY